VIYTHPVVAYKFKRCIFDPESQLPSTLFRPSLYNQLSTSPVLGQGAQFFLRVN
jgi:hypothetical protein